MSGAGPGGGAGGAAPSSGPSLWAHALLGKVLNLSDAVSSANGGGDAPPRAVERSQRPENAHLFPASSRHQRVSSELSWPLFSSRENVLVLDIFFEALNYETVEQKKAYEVSELLGVWVFMRARAGHPQGVGRASGCELTGDSVSAGDIGGQMGLFIGASLLTILEILDYLCEVGPGPSWGRGKESIHRIQEKVRAGHLPQCLPPGVPRQGPGILLEPKALPKALQHQSGNSPVFLPSISTVGALPLPMEPRTPSLPS